ncbi:MAG: replication-associated recombination protein A [Pseudomonadota bacterium]
MPDLFDGLESTERPLAERLRPARLSEVVGQDALLAESGPIGAMLTARRLSSLVLWGPPGTGKTTIARLLAAEVDLDFVQLSAIFTGAADLRRVFDAAKARRRAGGGTLLFVDEIHRFNKAQQDGFLPHMEDGTIVLLGATTENPSFELNAALLSRAEVVTLVPHDREALAQILARAEAEVGPVPVTEAARSRLLDLADGDARALLNMVERLLGQSDPVDPERLSSLLTRRAARYDKTGDQHYNLISALHKSVRGSDPDAALYWFARMLEGGEDPHYLARRILRMAVEDIGLADPPAMQICLAAWQTFERLGSPEGELALAEAVLYLALAPKSNAAYRAYGAARARARETGSLAPPMHILNAPTDLMKRQGYGSGYVYDHDTEEGVSGQAYFPDGTTPERFYAPVERGFERELAKRLSWFARRRAASAEEG